MKFLIALLTFVASINLYAQEDFSCKYKALYYEITVAVKYNVTENCYTMDTVMTEEGTVISSEKFSCKELKAGTMTGAELRSDTFVASLVRNAGVDPKKVLSLDYYQGKLDDDGGSIMALKITLDDTSIESVGLFTFMGGARSGKCL